MLPDYPDRSALHESLCVDASELKEGIRREALTPIAARFENQTNDPKFSRGCALTILGSQLMFGALPAYYPENILCFSWREDPMAELTEKVKDFFTSARINERTLMDVLSEFLAVEMGGQKLYEKALGLVSDSEVRTKFREFHRQTIKHQKVLTDVIHRLGGNTRAQSPGAKVATEKAQALLRSMDRNGLSKDQAELNAIENIVIAETKDHADWELIGKIARQATEDRLREILGPAASEVEQEEDEHLNWTRKKLGELQMQALVKACGSQTKSEPPKAKSPTRKSSTKRTGGRGKSGTKATSKGRSRGRAAR
jgi:rubrerythrin